MLYFFVGYGRYGIEALMIPNKNMKITPATKSVASVGTLVPRAPYVDRYVSPRLRHRK